LWKSSSGKKKEERIALLWALANNRATSKTTKESYHFNLHTYIHYYALKEEAMMARGALAHQGGVLAMARKE
jgi:acyl CoA:acetate/3-ketoacid CoA transferase